MTRITRIDKLIINLCRSIIVLVTAFDVYCCQWLTVEDEVNPMARYIMEEYSVWHLIGLKIVGTFIVTEFLRFLPMTCALGVASFMVWLLGLLTGVFYL
jgi:hypothetical protein